MAFAFFLANAIPSAGQTLTTLVTFNSANGRDPGALIQGANGNFFGLTSEDGVNLGGTIFEMTSSGKLIAQFDFNGFDAIDGEFPVGMLVQANGSLYGTTAGGGSGSAGTVFATAGGKVSVLYSFCSQTNCTDGAYPNAGLIPGRDGNFYGTTYQGGSGAQCNSSCGTVFEISPQSKLTTLYNFCSQANCSDGSVPFGGLVQGSDGNFYGTTTFGGNMRCQGGGCGTVFRLTRDGELTTLYNFCSKSNCADGALPSASLVEGSDGNLYGTTQQGGLPSSRCLANTFGCGTVFKITPAGELTTLHVFCTKANCVDGVAPNAPLILGKDGNLYGTTYFGGTNGPYAGTVFQITPAGKLTTLYSFCAQANCADGASPSAALLEAANGTFYGTTSGSGGEEGMGSVFRLSIGQGSER